MNNNRQKGTKPLYQPISYFDCVELSERFLRVKKYSGLDWAVIKFFDLCITSQKASQTGKSTCSFAALGYRTLNQFIIKKKENKSTTVVLGDVFEKMIGKQQVEVHLI